jgi:hypothetical protein
MTDDITYVVPVDIEGTSYVVNYYTGAESGDLHSRVYKLCPEGRVRLSDNSELVAKIRQLAWSRLNPER